MAALNDMYNTRIFELAAEIPHQQRLADADATASAHSKLCGSTIEVDVKMDDADRITAFGQTVKACLLGQASASVVGREIVGSTVSELRDVGRIMRHMLKDGGPVPTGRWADLGMLEPVKDYKARHASTLLIFDAVERAIAAIEARRAGPAPVEAAQ